MRLGSKVVLPGLLQITTSILCIGTVVWDDWSSQEQRQQMRLKCQCHYKPSKEKVDEVEANWRRNSISLKECYNGESNHQGRQNCCHSHQMKKAKKPGLLMDPSFSCSKVELFILAHVQTVL